MLKKPLITEKTMSLAGVDQYTFLVDLGANKMQIAKLVADKFKVDVVSVKTVRVKGKKKVQRSRKGYFETADVKKAIVQLKKGQKIALFEKAAKGDEEEVKVTTAEGETMGTVKEKKSLLKGTKVRIEKASASGKEPEEVEVKESKARTRQQSGKKKG